MVKSYAAEDKEKQNQNFINYLDTRRARYKVFFSKAIYL